jgi:pantoate--beta-alanine ligase
VRTLREIPSLRRLLVSWRAEGQSIALVPTMGNLHAGHLSLIALAREHAERTVVSVFVNPTQFGPNEDYRSYPRTLGDDQRALRRADVDLLFAPDLSVIYPRGEEAATLVSVPVLSQDLCGRFRPTHFDGVTSVVCRLFNLVGPDLAVFGEKDYQQLLIVRRMTADLHLPIRILAAPTLRESDGVAMSSRNQYLTARQRDVAPALHDALCAAAIRLGAGERDYRAIEAQGRRRLRQAGFGPDYFAVREDETLAVPDAKTRRLRVLAAAWLGRARLIDNVAVHQ